MGEEEAPAPTSTATPKPGGGVIVPPRGGSSGNSDPAEHSLQNGPFGQKMQWNPATKRYDIPSGIPNDITNATRPFDEAMALETATHTSSSTSQSFQDPAVLKQQMELAAAEREANLPLQQSQIANLQAQIAASTAATKMATDNLAFLKQKQGFEESIGRAADARATADQAFNQQAAIATLQMQQAQMMQAHNNLQAQMQQDTNKFNAMQKFAVDQANVDAAGKKQDRLQGLATDISQAAKDPGDRGALASLLLANSGWGQQDKALAGADLRTSDSLMPLEALLNLRNTTMASPDNPFTFSPMSTPTIDAPNMGGVTVPSLNLTGSAAAGAAPATAPAGAAPAPYQQQVYSDSPLTPGVDDIAQQVQSTGGFTWDPNGLGGAHAAAGGGMQDGAYISGEAGPEINIPLGPGKSMVLNEQQALSLGIDLSGVKKMAGGGLFDAPIGSSTTGQTQGAPTNNSIIPGGAGDTSLASAFLDQSFANAKKGTPWAGAGNTPPPVFASSPGTDPMVTALLAALSAQGQGIPADYYIRQAKLLAPTAMSASVIRRS